MINILMIVSSFVIAAYLVGWIMGNSQAVKDMARATGEKND
jgi:hypothetical protein